MSPLAKQEKAQLLSLARASIEREVLGGKPSFVPVEEGPLRDPSGAFVTLHLEGELRGCIGRIRSTDPLFQVVEEMAVAAATRDPRFPPVSAEEVPRLQLEISVLFPPRPLRDPAEIRVGEHGLIVSGLGHSGLLLPQVATEYGWDALTFLSHTCIKAGLPPEFWRSPSAKVETFSAEVFSEKEVFPLD